jgi:Mg-chelatase subunit ChlD
MAYRPGVSSDTQTSLLRSLLPSGVLSVVVHALILAMTFLAARGCDQGIQAEPGGEKFRTVGLAPASEDASDRSDSVSSDANEAEQEVVEEPVVMPDAETAVPDPEAIESFLPNSESPVSNESESAMDVIGPGTPLRSMVADPPIQALPSAGSRAGGGSPTPGPDDTSFMDIADNGERFVYVIDTSGSMGDNGRMGLAQSQLIKSLNMLRPHQSFQVIFYGESAREMIFPGAEKRRLHQATIPNIKLASRRINQEKAYGGTAHLPALSKAFRLRPDVVYFLTDGQSSSASSRQKLEKVLRENISSARVHVIEFASGPPETRRPGWLEELAFETGGKYRRIQL